jgi:hypothetical protein
VNRWLITGIIIIVVLILIGVAYDQGLFDKLNGGVMAMIVAGLAAPYMAVKNWLFGDKLQQQLKEKYQTMNEQEKVHRTDYDQEIALKQKRIAEMDKEIQLLDAKLEVLELKKKNIEQDVKSMSLEDKKSEVQNLFGD